MKRLLSVMETAKKLGLTHHTVYRFIRRGVIPHVRFGRNVKIDPDALADWIRQGGVKKSKAATEEKLDAPGAAEAMAAKVDEWQATNPAMAAKAMAAKVDEWQAKQKTMLAEAAAKQKTMLAEAAAKQKTMLAEAGCLTGTQKSRRTNAPAREVSKND